MRKSSKGVTLIELMITVAIVAILGAIAYPSYRAHVMRSHRSEAQTHLLKMAQECERWNVTKATYAGCPITTPTPNGLYTVTLTNTSATTFTITATAAGTQASDTDCFKLSIDQTNLKKAEKKDTTDNSSKCWD